MMVVNDVLVSHVLDDNRHLLLAEQHRMVSSNAKRVVDLLPLLFLNAFDDGLQRTLDMIHPLVILRDNSLLLIPDLLADICLLVDFVLLSFEFFFEQLYPLVLIEFIQLVFEYSIVSTFPLPSANLFVPLKARMNFDLQVLSILAHLDALDLIFMQKGNT